MLCPLAGVPKHSQQIGTRGQDLDDPLRPHPQPRLLHSSTPFTYRGVTWITHCLSRRLWKRTKIKFKQLLLDFSNRWICGYKVILFFYFILDSFLPLLNFQIPFKLLIRTKSYKAYVFFLQSCNNNLSAFVKHTLYIYIFIYYIFYH